MDLRFVTEDHFSPASSRERLLRAAQECPAKLVIDLKVGAQVRPSSAPVRSVGLAGGIFQLC